MSHAVPRRRSRGDGRAPYPVRPGLTFWLGLTLALTSISSFLAWRGNAVVGDNAALHAGLSWHLLVSVPCLYFLCICVHDGVHGVLLRRRWASQGAAWILSLVICLPFPLLQAAHLKHHGRLGRDDDPEAIVYDVSLPLLLVRLPFIPFFYLRSLRGMGGAAIAFTFLHLATVATLMLAVDDVALGWALPVLLAITWFGFTTVYVPHGPLAARLMPWLRANSGWHDDHHRDPRYPFHQYAAVRAFHLVNDAQRGLDVDDDAAVAFWARPVPGLHRLQGAFPRVGPHTLGSENLGSGS